ncbi:hydrolase 1, exosortase A system-associated [Noviherbaspirillum sp.]|uniref:hydrolase 1, exosortase A system-associated n=1 Tax=Noviherbaspirillum sp. TaxID=1926288 RepID=UPI002FE1F70E
MNYIERAVRFECEGKCLYGILSVPVQAASRGVLIVVGGPQYRAGSHRQFTLLARQLASQGVPVMRFDYRGMGDSDGEIRTFESIDADMRQAVDRFFNEVPALDELVIWGLCDAASASIFYAHTDARVTGLVLLNPWVRTDEGMAKAYLKHYYLTRLLNRDMWLKIVRGQFGYREAASSLIGMIRKSVVPQGSNNVQPSGASREFSGVDPLPERMRAGLALFRGKVLIILSGNDLTAKEFEDVVNASRKWQKLLRGSNYQRRDLPEANHTFAQRDWRDQVASWTRDWIASW